MKTFLSITLFAAILFTSCGTSQTKENETTTDEDITATEETTETKNPKNCDEFIEQYAEWMDNYITLIDKYMKNPMDPSVMQEYMKLAQESTNWMTQWTTGLAFCAADEKYEKKFNEISEKAEKKLKELGIE